MLSFRWNADAMSWRLGFPDTFMPPVLVQEQIHFEGNLNSSSCGTALLLCDNCLAFMEDVVEDSESSPSPLAHNTCRKCGFYNIGGPFRSLLGLQNYSALSIAQVVSSQNWCCIWVLKTYIQLCINAEAYKAAKEEDYDRLLHADADGMLRGCHHDADLLLVVAGNEEMCTVVHQQLLLERNGLLSLQQSWGVFCEPQLQMLGALYKK